MLFVGYALRHGGHFMKHRAKRKKHNSVNRIIKRIAAAVDLPPCRVHDFRHSFASILFENNTSLKDVFQLLGHGQTSTTERIYVHKKRVGNIESINTIANVIGF